MKRQYYRHQHKISIYGPGRGSRRKHTTTFHVKRFQIANISFMSRNIITGSYRVDLEKVTEEQFNPFLEAQEVRSILAIDIDTLPAEENNQRFTWGLGPYITHRLFNPDLPLSLETGAEVKAGYQITPSLKISGAVRKSVLTNLTDNNESNSTPRVHSDWPYMTWKDKWPYPHYPVENLAPDLWQSSRRPFRAFFAGVRRTSL